MHGTHNVKLQYKKFENYSHPTTPVPFRSYSNPVFSVTIQAFTIRIRKKYIENLKRNYESEFRITNQEFWVYGGGRTIEKCR